ncbi:MAG: hypothetical protein ABJB85_05990 [Nitrososphaerota archaeon]
MKVQERKPQQPKASKSKVTKKSPTRDADRSVSQLQSELRKHSDARKKIDSAIMDIRKELKDLLLIHHASIKDLQKQVAQMHKKIATIDSSKKSTKSKITGKKTASNKKTTASNKKTTASNKKTTASSSKKSKKNTNIRKNSRKR